MAAGHIPFLLTGDRTLGTWSITAKDVTIGILAQEVQHLFQHKPFHDCVFTKLEGMGCRAARKSKAAAGSSPAQHELEEKLMLD